MYHHLSIYLQLLALRQLLDCGQLSLQPLFPTDNRRVGLTTVANAGVLQLLQQCLELHIEFVECKRDTSLTHQLRKLRIELHDFLSHALLREKVDAVGVYRVGKDEQRKPSAR